MERPSSGFEQNADPEKLHQHFQPELMDYSALLVTLGEKSKEGDTSVEEAINRLSELVEKLDKAISDGNKTEAETTVTDLKEEFPPAG